MDFTAYIIEKICILVRTHYQLYSYSNLKSILKLCKKLKNMYKLKHTDMMDQIQATDMVYQIPLYEHERYKKSKISQVNKLDYN